MQVYILHLVIGEKVSWKWLLSGTGWGWTSPTMKHPLSNTCVLWSDSFLQVMAISL